MSGLRLFIECMKEARKTRKAMKQIREMDLTEEALRQLVTTVAFGANEVEIELKLKDGRSLVFRRRAVDSPGYDSFKERFEKSKKNKTQTDMSWGE